MNTTLTFENVYQRILVVLLLAEPRVLVVADEAVRISQTLFSIVDSVACSLLRISA